MHYTGMAAARFMVHGARVGGDVVQDNDYLVVAVTLGTLTLSALVAIANGLLRYREMLDEVQQGRRHLDAMLDAAFELVLTIDHQGIIRSASRASARMLGWESGELVGQSMSVLIRPAEADRFQAALARYVQTRERQLPASELEIVGIHREGQQVPLRASIGVSERDDLPWFVVFAADIRERKAMEQAVRDREQQYRSLIRNIPGVAFRCLLDADWTMLFISDAVEPLTGWPAQDFIERRRSMASLYHPDDYQAVADQVFRAIEAGAKYNVEYRLFDREGREHWIWESGSAVYSDEGVPLWIDGVLLDQTETKLRNAEYAGKVNAISRAMAVIEFDMSGRILDANDNFASLIGYSIEQLKGQNHRMLCAPDTVDSDEYRRVWDDLRRGVFRSGEVQRFGPDGHEVWLHATYNPILDIDGRPFKVVKLATDLTPRRAMEQELRNARDRAEQAAAARSSFLANMSHEIRTPMNAIIGFSEVLLRTELSEQQRKHLLTVERSSRSLLRLLNDILDTAKLDRGAVELERLDFSLREVCEQVCDTHRLAAERKGLVLELAYGERLGEFFIGDPLRLQQVLVNLVGNAIKFTETGRVRLVASGEPGAVRLEVQDTGIGIAADRLDHIFDPFAQADASMSRRFGGTGLGTTISRQLVELMGGDIGVQSVQGQGSVFRVDLPLPAGRPSDSGLRAAPPPSMPPLRFLCADDVPQNLELLVLNLRPLGHEVHTVGDGDAAVAAYAGGGFDVVLMDVQMPGTDGLEATRRIRAWERDHGLPEVPVIALTASVLDKDRQEALDAGMDGFAGKPLDMEALMAEVARLLGLVCQAPLATAPGGHGGPIDWARAQQRWGGQAPLAQAIARFLREHAGLGAELDGLRRQGDLAALTQALHRVRGVAGNLGLGPVADVLAAAEAAATRGDGDGVASALAPLGDTLAAVAASLATRALPGDQAPPARPTAMADLGAARAACQTLADALSRARLDDEAMARLGTALAGAAAQSHQALRAAVDDFDFDQALEHLKAIQAWLAEQENLA
jgi:PAS domain S-box-containing protein